MQHAWAKKDARPCLALAIFHVHQDRYPPASRIRSVIARLFLSLPLLHPTTITSLLLSSLRLSRSLFSLIRKKILNSPTTPLIESLFSSRTGPTATNTSLHHSFSRTYPQHLNLILHFITSKDNQNASLRQVCCCCPPLRHHSLRRRRTSRGGPHQDHWCLRRCKGLPRAAS